MSTRGTVGVMRRPLRPPRCSSEAESGESDSSSSSLAEIERPVSAVVGSEDAGRAGSVTAGFADCERAGRGLAAGGRGGFAAGVGTVDDGGAATEGAVDKRVELLCCAAAATACADLGTFGISALTLAFPYACNRVRLADPGRPAVKE